MKHRISGFSAVNDADFFFFSYLESPCFLKDPVNVGNFFLSGSSIFSKSWLHIYKFLVHILLKDFEYYITNMWNEHNCLVVWTFFSISLLCHWNENWPIPPSCQWWVFQIWVHMKSMTQFNSFMGMKSLSFCLKVWFIGYIYPLYLLDLGLTVSSL